MYRLRIDLTYSTTNNANIATTNINNALAGLGYSETATRTNAQVSLEVSDIPDQDAAIALRNALTAAWGSRVRSGGKVSLTRYET